MMKQRAKNVYGKIREVVEENAPRLFGLGIVALVGVSNAARTWIENLDPSWHQVVAQLLEENNLPAADSPLLWLYLPLVAGVAERLGKFTQRFTEPRKAVDGLVWELLKQEDQHGPEEGQE